MAGRIIIEVPPGAADAERTVEVPLLSMGGRRRRGGSCPGVQCELAAEWKKLYPFDPAGGFPWTPRRGE